MTDILLEPSKEVCNTRGERVFAFKNGGTFYLFEMHSRRTSDTGRLNLAWEMTKKIARWFKMPLINVFEIAPLLAKVPPHQGGEFLVTDHATGKKVSLFMWKDSEANIIDASHATLAGGAPK